MSLTALARELEMNIAGVGFAMENKLKLGDQPVSLDMARLLLGTNDVPGQILIAPTTGFLRL
ncbi:MAG: hypothetical protein MUO22_08030 [Sedimentisphaerales bacterium]|nr:hypothetical protein [Sedimentisphaerales bacterium]